MMNTVVDAGTSQYIDGKALLDGLQREYEDMDGHQIAMYHGFPREWGFKVKTGEATQVPADLWYDLSICIGGYRSGKTYSALMRLANDATQYPGNEILVVRKRHEQLHNTFLKDFKALLHRITHGHSEWLIQEEGAPHPGAYEMLIRTPDPARPSKVIFRIEPDGDEESIRDSFKGYELGLFICEEGSQLRAVTLDTLLSRMSKKIYIDPLLPPGVGEGCRDHADNQWPDFKPYAMLLSNPAFAGHWLADKAGKLEQDHNRGEKTDAIVIRTSMEDNTHLPPGYIEKEKARYKDDPVGYDMYIKGLDGIKVEGRPVFIGHFDHKLHVAKLNYNPEWPLIVGLDFGYRRPAAIFAQYDPDIDGLNVLDEFLGKELEAEEFGTLVKDFIKRRFPKVKSLIEWGDPAGFQKTDKGDPTIPRINKLGFRIRPSNNDIDSGLNEERRLLRELRKKGSYIRPRMMIDPCCSVLHLGFRQGYCYPIDSKGFVGNKPKKDNWFDNPFDALRYLVMGTFGLSGDAMNHANPWEVAGQGSGDDMTALPPERLEM